MSRIAAATVAVFLYLAFAAFAPVQGARGRPFCANRDRVIELLAQRYKEAPVASGVTNSGGLVEVLTDAKGGTWSIIVTTPDGLSCLVATGEAWRQIEQTKKEPHA